MTTMTKHYIIHNDNNEKTLQIHNDNNDKTLASFIMTTMTKH